MAKNNNSTNWLGLNNILLIIAILSVSFAIFSYLKLTQVNSFLKGISSATTVRLPNKVEKIVYYMDPKQGFTVFLTNEELDPQTAIKISTGKDIIDLRQQLVNYYNKTYFIASYSIGEGNSDYLIFDEDGKVIADGLLENLYKTESNQFFAPKILSLREDGIMAIQLFPDGMFTSKSKVATFDITTGKLKKLITQ